MRLNEYIQKQRGRTISEDECNALIAKKHGRSYTNGTTIYRGIDGYGDYVYIEPEKSSSLRVSANTSNYYTLIMDNTSEWSQYPKRSRSLICTTQEDYAESFGDVYFVYPENGAKIGVCPQNDIWGSGHYKDYIFEGLDYYISKIIRTETIKTDYADQDYIEMKRVFMKVDKMKDGIFTELNKYSEKYGEYITPFFKEYLNSGKTFLEWIEFLMDPKKCGFQLVKAGDHIKKQSEVWISSPCVLVKANH